MKGVAKKPNASNKAKTNKSEDQFVKKRAAIPDDGSETLTRTLVGAKLANL